MNKTTAKKNYSKLIGIPTSKIKSFEIPADRNTGTRFVSFAMVGGKLHYDCVNVLNEFVSLGNIFLYSNTIEEAEKALRNNYDVK